MKKIKSSKQNDHNDGKKIYHPAVQNILKGLKVG